MMMRIRLPSGVISKDPGRSLTGVGTKRNEFGARDSKPVGRLETCHHQIIANNPLRIVKRGDEHLEFIHSTLFRLVGNPSSMR